MYSHLTDPSGAIIGAGFRPPRPLPQSQASNLDLPTF